MSLSLSQERQLSFLDGADELIFYLRLDQWLLSFFWLWIPSFRLKTPVSPRSGLKTAVDPLFGLKTAVDGPFDLKTAVNPLFYLKTAVDPLFI